jgi:hypothetical protein
MTEGKGLLGSSSSDTLSDSDIELAAPLADYLNDKDEEQDTGCVFCTGHFSEDHNVEEWLPCAKYSRLAHTISAGMVKDFVCKPCQG